MIKKKYDVVIIGGGAAGLAAAEAVVKHGLAVALLERESILGGILMQCIHNGFGLKRFNEELTGPEYAEMYVERVLESKVDIFTDCTALDINGKNDEKVVTACSKEYGIIQFKATAVILAMGCRERNRGNIGTAGSRPAGIYTAGLAQRLINIDGLLPGKDVVILGSGDIGLIMARRLSWVGCNVKCVVEIMPHPSGLTRNIVQCLDDFNIPLHLSHTISCIHGKKRVESVDIAPLENGVVLHDKSFNISCDTLLLSVGLVPENELSRTAGITLNSTTNGPIVDADLMTDAKGIFACGNVLHVHDLVDFVSEEAERCAENAVNYVRAKDTIDNIPIQSGANVRYVVPNHVKRGNNKLLMRSMVVKQKATLTVKVNVNDKTLLTKTLRHIKPAEMIGVDLELNELPDKPIEVELI